MEKQLHCIMYTLLCHAVLDESQLSYTQLQLPFITCYITFTFFVVRHGQYPHTWKLAKWLNYICTACCISIQMPLTSINMGIEPRPKLLAVAFSSRKLANTIAVGTMWGLECGVHIQYIV